ncbi:RES family NAD+ phosphorylase [Rhodococcus sp. USK13]|uniref:RES family NAD+ phosphorylase n=1 Tax=Rhodococcus sp. USK13 TaxID=2806442 RepID=UPI001BD181FD|nr:RES family NAD+ phosphorylase [Rhodococcus sp. USK13]
MPNIEPPAAGLLRPAHKTVLTPGTRVWRVHSNHRAPHAPNPTAQPDELAGGRFDSLDGSYAYLYLADSPDGAIAETLCRDLPLHPSIDRSDCARLRSGRPYSDRAPSPAPSPPPHSTAHTWPRSDKTSGSPHAKPGTFVTTSRWAHAIRAADPDLDGLDYRPRHNEDTLAWILTTNPALTPDLTLDPTTAPLSLDHGPGRSSPASSPTTAPSSPSPEPHQRQHPPTHDTEGDAYRPQRTAAAGVTVHDLRSSHHPGSARTSKDSPT